MSYLSLNLENEKMLHSGHNISQDDLNTDTNHVANIESAKHDMQNLLDIEQIFVEKPELKKCIYLSLNGTIYDIACVIHYLYHETYKVTKIKSKIWYIFDGLKWRLSELGPYFKLSSEVVSLYEYCLKEEEQKRKILEDKIENLTNNVISEESPELDKVKNELKKILSTVICFNKIIEKLKNVNTKETICKECIYLFYDSEFNNCLDKNQNLICFQNGVLDLQKSKLRYGQRSDNISIIINTKFVVPKTSLDKQEFEKMLEEFGKFRKKIISRRQNRLVYEVSSV